MVEVVPDLGFCKKEKSFSCLRGGGGVSMVFVFGPAGKISGEFEFVVHAGFPPVEGVDEVIGGAGIRDVFIVEDAAEPGCFPMEGDFRSGLIGIREIIAVLFWLGDTGAAAVLQLEEDLWFPAPKGLGYLEVEFSDVGALAEQVGLRF